MILTGRDIKWYIESGNLKIEPVKPEQFQQNGIDLYVRNKIINLQWPDLPCSYFTHGQAHLVETIEHIEMPNDLMAFVGIRSTWARRGIFPPGTIVDAGFKGTLTIELFNGGPTFSMTREEKVIHLIFAKLTGPTEPYSGKYQGQKGITQAIEDNPTILPHVACSNCNGKGVIYFSLRWPDANKKCDVCHGSGIIG